MQHLDSRKLKSAMIDAAILRAERTMKDDQEPVVVHPLYRERWERTVRELQARRLRKKRKTRVLAFIIAAAIMALAGCAWIYRERIADFWVTAYEKYCTLESSDVDQESPKAIEEVYLPTYILDGYEMVYCQVDLFKIRAKWVDGGDYLIYTQTVISEKKNTENQNVLDNEIGEYAIKRWEDYTVFCHLHGDQYIFVWTNEYKYCLGSSKEIADDELKKKIENIQKSEEYTP